MKKMLFSIFLLHSIINYNCVLVKSGITGDTKHLSFKLVGNIIIFCTFAYITLEAV